MWPPPPEGTWVIDLDGVVWLDGRPIPGVDEAVARLRGTGVRVLFATNNSAPDALGAARAPGSLRHHHGGCRSPQLGRCGRRHACHRLTPRWCSRRTECSKPWPPGEWPLSPRGRPTPWWWASPAASPTTPWPTPLPRYGAGRVSSAPTRIRPSHSRRARARGRRHPGCRGHGGRGGARGGGQAAPADGRGHRRPGVRRAAAGHGGDRPSTDGALAAQLGIPFALVLSGVTREGHVPPTRTPRRWPPTWPLSSGRPSTARESSACYQLALEILLFNG